MQANVKLMTFKYLHPVFFCGKLFETSWALIQYRRCGRRGFCRCHTGARTFHTPSGTVGSPEAMARAHSVTAQQESAAMLRSAMSQQCRKYQRVIFSRHIPVVAGPRHSLSEALSPTQPRWSWVHRLDVGLHASFDPFGTMRQMAETSSCDSIYLHVRRSTTQGSRETVKGKRS